MLFRLQVLGVSWLKMAVWARLERATYGLEGSCSIQLSYQTIL